MDAGGSGTTYVANAIFGDIIPSFGGCGGSWSAAEVTNYESTTLQMRAEAGECKLRPHTGAFREHGLRPTEGTNWRRILSPRQAVA
jgi:hypothetical protein